LPSEFYPLINSKIALPFRPRTVTKCVENVLIGNTYGYVPVIRSGTLAFRGITNQLLKFTKTSKADYFLAPWKFCTFKQNMSFE